MDEKPKPKNYTYQLALAVLQEQQEVEPISCCQVEMQELGLDQTGEEMEQVDALLVSEVVVSESVMVWFY